jgi:hypothetical protein
MLTSQQIRDYTESLLDLYHEVGEKCSGMGPHLPKILEPAAEQFRQDPDGKQHVLNQEQIDALRGYLREWMALHAHGHEQAPSLRERIDGLRTQDDMCHWLHDALAAGISPI